MAKKIPAKAAPKGKALPGKTAGKDDAADFLKAAAKFKSAWKKSREAKAGSFDNSIPDIDDGTYEAATVGCRAGATKSGAPYFAIDFKITEGDFKDVKVSKFDSINREESLEYLAKTLQGFGYDTEELEISDLPELAKAINAEKPTVQIRIKNDPYTDKSGNAQKALRIYVNKVVD